MNVQRVHSLIEAYGADHRRWPESEREAARALIAAQPTAFADALAEADAADAWLDAAPRPHVSAALRDRIIAQAPTAGRGWMIRPHLNKLGWALAGGWAAAAFAGAVAGVGLSSELTQSVRADAVLYQASATGVDDVEVLG
ncbi:hypothetical protein ASG17_04210 [Brevundimonas sp. Leaf363]|uniref:hypothetical protein n=1 Tax=Brevundimonas sp. Leaf363 TaxID=1736353 RepID=UPI0006F71BAB|nr:hypothetical protein [Brevundimonas sp. Leaf363]KQS55305.1 hypothetical protein ASG17_04210 [Brevundimonas sp. Leaf363]